MNDPLKFSYLLSTNLKHRTFIEKLIDDKERIYYKFKCEFLVDNFRPNEIRLKLDGSKLVVDATKQIKSFKSESSLNDLANFSNNTPLIRETENFKREIALPSFLNLKTLTSYLETYQKDENVLVIEAYVDEKSDLFKTLGNNKPSNSSYEIRPPPLIKPRTSVHKPSPNNGEFLKFKFDLKGYESANINLSIRKKSILHISAFKTILDDRTNELRKTDVFNHEIDLPPNVEIHNIKNCFDESEGILRIEIPFSKLGNNKSSGSGSNKKNSEKYLELTFDLYDFKFDTIKVENERVLVVTAHKKESNENFVRKYVLPDWVENENILVSEEKREIDNELKNLLIVQLPIF
jgi:HSP20 family molecular chaperone IbpA